MATMSTYKGVVKQLHRTARELPALTRSVSDAVSELASTEAKCKAATDDLEARSALVRALEALDAELRGRGGPGGVAPRWRRASLAKQLSVLRSIESDARLEDREAWALSLVELSRARVRKAVAEVDAALRLVVEGGALRLLHGERAAPSFARDAG
jgi:septal ring factor EnvC (AmiA/AmiB activator)